MNIDLLLQIEETMLSNIQKKDPGPPMQETIEAIVATDEYIYLRFYDSAVDTDEYIINFIRFAGTYTADPERIARLFSLLINNARHTSMLFLDPAVKFMANPSRENLLLGFFTK
jgi:hypothetical protein